ncbi:2-polyprenylphenol 6-hydroxylase [Kaistia dalseonensis]|uniref:Ubiquinone biosynthesis protein n=1 Tax=Kaistia dalseonensis TaxID=410840 RepID=A0ABU0H5H6_9HYPH|nr:2-polyprenylphenol 6-hydroxylase [Kaistia dalseonensis]MCX5494971.1 2-polyprenylphenol 6-hydroxylase [Kaistia dalseonensis]MDQ0437552.1 ubiquinone biosynthesis protein [Kaistia dalseonensis]
MAIGPAALFRLAAAGFVLAREGAFSIVDIDDIPPGAAFGIRIGRLFERRSAQVADRGERISHALNRLGPSYVKLGQFLATRADLVGDDVAEALGKLRDEIEPFGEAAARATIERNFGRPVDTIFSAFSPPIAAASIAQVHKAEVTDADGTVRVVAVKVLRPGVRGRFRRDLSTFYAGAGLVEKLDPASRRLKPVSVVDILARSVSMEMDLRLEAAALSEMAERTKGDPGFRVPTIDWARTARDVLTLEWIDGVKLSDPAGIAAAGHDPKLVARHLMQAFLRHAMRDGFFHADMHQGNLFVDAKGDVVAVDFGIMGRLGKAERRFLAEILYGFIKRDYLRIAEVHMEAGYVPARHAPEDFAQALRAIGEPIHGQPARDISMAKLLTLLFEITELFDMQTRPELLMLQKTMVVVEGVARSLDPDFDMWDASEPVVRGWIERNLGPAGKIEEAAGGLSDFGRAATRLPGMVEHGARIAAQLDQATRNGLTLSPDTVEAIGRAEGRGNRWLTIGIWVVAALLAWIGLR